MQETLDGATRVIGVQAQTAGGVVSRPSRDDSQRNRGVGQSVNAEMDHAVPAHHHKCLGTGDKLGLDGVTEGLAAAAPQNAHVVSGFAHERNCQPADASRGFLSLAAKGRSGVDGDGNPQRRKGTHRAAAGRCRSVAESVVMALAIMPADALAGGDWPRGAGR